MWRSGARRPPVVPTAERAPPGRPSAINAKLAAAPRGVGEAAPPTITTTTLRRWVKSLGGSVRGICTRPKLTPENKAERVKFCKWALALLEQPHPPVVTYTDEKWFQPDNNVRGTQVVVARQDGEAEFLEDGHPTGLPRRPEGGSRRYVTKVMMCFRVLLVVQPRQTF